MSAPVNPNPHVVGGAQPAQAAQPAHGPAPAGVAAAPTTLQSAGAPPAEKGYIERAILAIKDFFVSLFEKIFFCFKKEETRPAPETVINPQDQERQRQILRFPQLHDHQIIAEFNKLFKDEGTRKFVFEAIGRSAPGFQRPWQSYATIGQNMVNQNPKLLLPYLIQATTPQ